MILNELFPGVFIGDQDAANACLKRSRLRSKRGITGILRCNALVEGETLPEAPEGVAFEYVPLWDDGEDDLLPYVDNAVGFIRYCIDHHGKVLVHCQAGRCRSAAIICAYLMRAWGLEFDLVEGMVHEKEEDIEISENFRRQLKLWGTVYKMDMSLDTEDHRQYWSGKRLAQAAVAQVEEEQEAEAKGFDWRCALVALYEELEEPRPDEKVDYLLSKAANAEEPHILYLRICRKYSLSFESRPKAVRDEILALRPQKATRRLRCGRCGKTLCGDANIVHGGKKCTSYFVEVMDWMTDVIESAHSGAEFVGTQALMCSCGAKLGSWNWYGLKCSCGKFTAPGMQLHTSKVDDLPIGAADVPSAVELVNWGYQKSFWRIRRRDITRNDVENAGGMSDPKTPLRKSLRLAGRKRSMATVSSSSSSSESASMVTPAKPARARQTATPSTKATTPKGPPESPFYKKRLRRQATLGQSFEDESDSDEAARTAERSESRARKRRKFQSSIRADDEGDSSSDTEYEGQQPVDESSEESEPVVMNNKAQTRAERLKAQREHEKKLTRQLFVMRNAAIEEEEEEDSEGEREEQRQPRVDTGYPRLMKSTLFDTSSVEGSDEDDDADSMEGFVVADDVVDEEVSPTPIQVEGPASMEDLPAWHWTVPKYWKVWFRKEEESGEEEEEDMAREIQRCILATGRSHRKCTPSPIMRRVMDTQFDASGEVWADLSPADLTAPQGPLRRNILHALAMRDCQSVSCIFKQLRGSCTQVASAKMRDKFGLTPLHLAAINPTFDAQSIRDLLAVVSPKLQFETDKIFSATPLHLALLRPDAAVAVGLLAAVGGGRDRRRLLKARGFAEKRSAVLIAALEKSVEKLSILRPADYQELDKQGLSALHLAAGSPEAIRYLIKYGNCGYNCTAKDTGVTPLHMAAVEGSATGVQELLNLGADAGKCDNCGWSPLLYALQCVDSEDAGADAVEVLLRHDMTRKEFPQLSAIEALLKKDPGRAQPRVARLLRFVCERPAFFKMLNDFLRPRLDLLLPGGPLAFILRARSAEPFAAALDMENKMKLLEMSVRRDKPSFVPVMKLICLRGPHFLQESIKRVLTFETSQMRWGHLNVSWYNERGSCLGPQREMWTCIFDELPDFAFERSDDGRLLLPRLDVELDVFVGVGRLMALAMVHGVGMKLPLHRTVVESLKMSDPFRAPEMDDLWEWLRVWSPTFYNSMKYLQDNDLTGLEEELCLPCGQDTKEAYILIELERKVYRPGAAAAMKRGIRDVLKSYELKLFSSEELAVILHSAGEQPLDLDDWKAHTEYTGYDESSPQIVWFWKLLRSLSDGEVRLVLLFATGLTSVPVGGFAQLRSLGSTSNGFRIVRTDVGNTSCPDLPRASTCFNQLTLPAYNSEKMLNMKLMTAARLGSKGFEFA